MIKNSDRHTPIVIDFDETLLLRNSTAEYINSLRPRLLGFILVNLLKIIRPWAWLPKPFRGKEVQDWFLVIIPTILLPWTILLWRNQGEQLAQDYGNQEIIDAVQQNADSPITIASVGFKFIIEPILQHLPIRQDNLIGCGFWRGASDRAQGKLSMMRSSFSESEIKEAILVTDSKDDLPLLQIVAHPCLTVWSLAKYVNPFSDFWLYVLLSKLKNILNARAT